MHTTKDQATIVSFVGSWELQSFTEVWDDGSTVEPMGNAPTGFLVYSEDGIVSAQLSASRSNTEGNPATESTNRNVGLQISTPYIGYSGAFTVNVRLQEVVHHPSVAHDSSLIGKDLRRKFQFDADSLTLTASAPDAGDHIVKAQLVWRRYDRGHTKTASATASVGEGTSE